MTPSTSEEVFFQASFAAFLSQEPPKDCDKSGELVDIFVGFQEPEPVWVPETETTRAREVCVKADDREREGESELLGRKYRTEGER